MGSRDALPRLTALRFWAALLVIGYHLSRQYAPLPWVSPVLWYGRDGVTFFFVLSGFVLAWTYGGPDGRGAGRARGVRAGEFWRRRFARVWPLAALTTLGWAVLGGAGPGPVASSLLLLQGWSPRWSPGVDPASWSLSDEAFFYLLFPLLCAGLTRCSQRTLVRLAAVCAAAGPLLWLAGAGVADAGLRSWTLDYLPPARLPQFALGAALGLLVRRGWLPRARLRPGLGGCGALLLTVHLLFAWWGGVVPQARWYSPYTASQAVTAPLFAALVLAAARRDATGAPVRAVWLRLGRWSFAWYLVHQAVFTLLLRGYGTPHTPVGVLGGWLATVALSLPLAAGLYHCVERPCEAWLRRGRGVRPHAERGWARSSPRP